MYVYRHRTNQANFLSSNPRPPFNHSQSAGNYGGPPAGRGGPPPGPYGSRPGSAYGQGPGPGPGPGYGNMPPQQGPSPRMPAQQYGSDLNMLPPQQQPPNAGRPPQRYDSMPLSDPQGAPPVNQMQARRPQQLRDDGPGPTRVGSAPPAQQVQQQQVPAPTPKPAPPQHSNTAPVKPQGPATFEEMGIPQGKTESDCVSVIKMLVE